MIYRWRHCALTQECLQEPIVMCGLGRLYSKQNIIEQLLDKEKDMPDSCNHIKSLKDVKNLILSPNPIYKDEDKTEGLLDVRSAKYICKLMGLEMNGKHRFIGLWTCGCVFSERALKEIGAKICSLCQTPFTEQDIVILNGNEEEIALMEVKMEARNARRKAGKKDKSAKKAAAATVTSTDIQRMSITGCPKDVQIKKELEDTNGVASTSAKPIVSTKIIKTELIKKEGSSSKGLGSGGVSVKEAQMRALKRTAASEALMDPEIKKLKDLSATSVSTDPKSSDVYKSLFTTHKSAHEQERAHWVTYNPFYN